MKVINKYHKRDMKSETTARTDNVDRSGYIPLDLQHARLMKAGKTLEEIRDYQYNSDYHEVMEHLEDKDFFEKYRKNLSNNMEKVEVDTFMKKSLDNLSYRINKHEELERLKKEYLKLENEKAIKQQAINEYKLMNDLKLKE